MIIVKIFQGLGNQMFQYALGQSLSLRHHIPVKYDLSWYNENSWHRKFGLNNFKTHIDIATADEIYQIKHGIYGQTLADKIARRLRPFKPYYAQPIFKEDLSSLDHNILNIKTDTYIEGYFTSEFFFKDYRKKLLEDFDLIKSPNDYNTELIQQIRQENSVALSVRRGDFLLYDIHNVCHISYFNNAISYISTHIKDPVLYIFSDDNDWVKENIKTNLKHYFITHNYPDFYEDLRIMKNCRHHIIPNSTFSWWGAWLCDYDKKIVIAPQKWLNSNTIDYSYYLPSEWIRIDN